MRGDLSTRAREREVSRLQAGYAGGALGTQTFEQRLETALTADSPEALRQTTSDLRKLSLLDRARRWLMPDQVVDVSSGLLAGVVGSRPTIIGRSRGCDVVLTDDSVSRRHVVLEHEGDRIMITDLGSTNGTLVNGRSVRQAEVRAGDRLQLGGLELLL